MLTTRNISKFMVWPTKNWSIDEQRAAESKLYPLLLVYLAMLYKNSLIKAKFPRKTQLTNL